MSAMHQPIVAIIWASMPIMICLGLYINDLIQKGK